MIFQKIILMRFNNYFFKYNFNTYLNSILNRLFRCHSASNIWWNLNSFIHKTVIFDSIEKENMEIIRLLLSVPNIDLTIPSILIHFFK